MAILSTQGCLDRQTRLRERLAALNIDAAVLTDNRDIYYLTGMLLERWPACLLLYTGGGSWLAAHSAEDARCVDDFVTYPWHTFFTMNPDPMRQLVGVVAKRLEESRELRRVGYQGESLSHALASTIARLTRLDEWAAIDDTLADLQRRKDADELDLIRLSIRADLAAYTAAQAMIAPDVNELDVLAAAQRAAMHNAGESVYHGGDYRSGEQGGPARDHRVERGELYIVDAQTVYRGYWCDLSRTYVVGGEPTDLQQSIYDHIAAILRDVAGLLRPGVSGTALWRKLDERIREHPALADSGLVHHGGHGVGLRAHEAPDLNRDREGIFEPGNVVAVEPGGYTTAARYGVRLENMYLITEDGAENLSDYPMNLVPQK
jgi:Xaa-Pro dipeptidase